MGARAAPDPGQSTHDIGPRLSSIFGEGAGARLSGFARRTWGEDTATTWEQILGLDETPPADSEVTQPHFEEDEEVEDDDSRIALRNLKKLAKTLREESTKLNEVFSEGEAKAQTILEYFGEKASTGNAFDALYLFFQQLTEFSTQFKAALARVQKEQARLAKRTPALTKTKRKLKEKRRSTKSLADEPKKVETNQC